MNAYDNRKAQYELIQTIRQDLPVGYSASRWDEQICITYSVQGTPDSTQRWFVKDTAEWEALEPSLGRHSTEVVALLAMYGERVGEDLSAYLVYGSPMRSMTHVWARIEGAVYMTVDKQSTGYHTYIAVPLALSDELVSRFELVFVSR